jgi:hypothetical protein
MSVTTIVKWTLRTAVVAIWLTIAADIIPSSSGLIDGEVWLTNQFADPILFAFASGMLFMVLISSEMWTEVAKIARAATPRLTKFFAVQFVRETADAPPPSEAFAPKLVVSKTDDVQPMPEPQTMPDEEPLKTASPSAAAQYVLENPPAVERAKPFEGKRQPVAYPQTAVPAKPASSLDIIMPNQVVQLAANFAHWDKIHTLKTWQVAWLWNDWEPVSDNLKGKPCLADCLRLEAHIEAGALSAALGKDHSLREADIRRQDLVDYALELNLRPKFLFPEERSWLKRKLHEWRQRDVPAGEAENFATYSETKLVLYKILQIINTDAVALEIKTAMRKGGCEGIARRRSGGVVFGFERIPRWMWNGLTIDWLGNVTGHGIAYTDLRVRFKPGYYQAAQIAPAADADTGYFEENQTAARSA